MLIGWDPEPLAFVILPVSDVAVRSVTLTRLRQARQHDGRPLIAAELLGGSDSHGAIGFADGAAHRNLTGFPAQVAADVGLNRSS